MVCPVVAMKCYLSVRPCTDHNSPLFLGQKGGPLTRLTFVDSLNTCLLRAGLNPKLYNGHSFRKGFATSASCAAVPDHLISKLGRWKSQVYKSYISLPAAVVAKAHESISSVDLCHKF